jgi:leucyl aminopeptidase
LAGEEEPELIMDVTRLGAARVALGPDLLAMFCTDDDVAEGILAGGEAEDPLWRMPPWRRYDHMLSSMKRRTKTHTPTTCHEVQ